MSDDLGIDLLQLLKDGYNCDTTVVCDGGKQLEVHKVILAARSNVFRTMLDVDMKERESRSVEIKDYDPEVVTEFFKYLYSAQIRSDSPNLIDLLQIGHQYQVPSLVDQCLKRLVLEISAKNVAELGALAEKYELVELTEACTQFLAENFKDLEPENLGTLPSSLTWVSCKAAFASFQEKSAPPRLSPVEVVGVKTTYKVNLFGGLGEAAVIQAGDSIKTTLSVDTPTATKLVGVGLYLNEGSTPVTLTCSWEYPSNQSPVTVNTTVKSFNCKVPTQIALPNPVQMYSYRGHYKLNVKFGKACYYLKGTEKGDNQFCLMEDPLTIFNTDDDCQISVLYFEN